MKTIAPFLSILLFFVLSLTGYASVQAQVYHPTIRKAPIRKVPGPVLRKPVLLRADLVMVESMQTYQQNGIRFIAVKVKNQGNLQAAANLLELRVSWRVDYEHWSMQELFKDYIIPPLAPGAQYTIHYAIPDHQISTNEGFGSNNISFRFFADKQKKIPESVEYNNVRTYYIPVLRD